MVYLAADGTLWARPTDEFSDGRFALVEPPEYELWVDGSCHPNPGPGGWAAVVLASGSVAAELTGSEPSTSNNRMELMAAIGGLEWLTEPSRVTLHTDSQYVQRGITTWIDAWRRRGWRTSGGSPVLNRDLWERLVTLSGMHQIKWRWVRGHAGSRWNERADQLAGQARLGSVRSAPL